MRTLATTLLALLLPALAAAEVGIVRVQPSWREATSFKRISEYFTGHENTGGEIVARSHPEARGGYYFLVRLTNPDAARATKFVLSYFLPGENKARTQTFDVALPAGKPVVELGVTGADWPSAKTEAVAWKIEVLDVAQGLVLSSAKSYLWEKPAE